MSDTADERVISSEQGPAAVRTFLIADVRGYSQFTTDHGDEAAVGLAAVFASLCRDVITGHGGEVVELRGDEALAVFASARGALTAACVLQDREGHDSLGSSSAALGIGVGLDTGEAIPFEGGFRGAAVNLAARSVAWPGEARYWPVRP